MNTLSALRPETRLGRPVALTTLFAFLIATIPGPALASAAQPIERFAASLDQRPDGHAAPMAKSRLMTGAAMRSAQGRSGENPYLAGQSKMDVVYKGVNLMSGNFTATGTDLTFEGGYGIPVNVTRSYSANSIDEGPLGKGWSLSVDVRSTAGGVLKSGAAPVRAIPTAFKERPAAQVDPNAELATGVAAQPLEAVLATDAGGTEETIQVDADGVLTTPPWDRNTNETQYEDVVQTDGSILRRMVTNKTFSPDGTVYLYARKGTYPYGTRPWNDPSATSQPSDVMKIVSATDRQGNVTTYAYDDLPAHAVSFQKANGLVTESRLTGISMPNGHHIDFTWSNVTPSGTPHWRITAASDGIANGAGRTVQYTYDAAGNLTGVTTPGGKTTTYGIGGAASGGTIGNGPSGATGLITSITDPRGLTTTIDYVQSGHTSGGSAVVARRLAFPNGTYLHVYPVDEVIDGQTSPQLTFAENTTANPLPNTIAFNSARIARAYDGASDTITVTIAKSTQQSSGFSDSAAGAPYAQSVYAGATQDLVETRSYDYTTNATDGNAQLWLDPSAPADYGHIVTSTTAYNFMGNPLKKTTATTRLASFTKAASAGRSTTVEYAYWGVDKYWQQKAVRDEGALFGSDDRIAYTDYYTAADPAGTRGQTKKVYDAKYTTYVADPNTVYPNGVSAGSTNAWRYDLVPETDTHAARFEYDAKGRPVDVWKLQGAPSGGPLAYVQTHTTYGPDDTYHWGQAASVVEDAGGIARTTNTLEYDVIGRATKFQDAKGQIFETHYDKDGVVQSVDRIVGGVANPVVTYTYGTAGITNGQTLSVKDELSGVEQSFGYCPSGGGIGQISGVTESGGPNASYSTAYTYTALGERATSTVTTPEGTRTWTYSGYRPAGTPTSGSRVFTRLSRPAASGVAAEVLDYAYDSKGRLTGAAFAQSPQPGFAIEPGHGAQSRARAHYEHAEDGTLRSVEHLWDNLVNGSYQVSPILANACDYESTGLARGLKTASRFYRGTGTGASGAWNLERTETYGYDAKNDQLTGANYGDGGANQIQSWGYDAAGNRSSDSSNPGVWSYDNLNRILSSPQGSYTHDALGNRLTGPGSTSHVWDSLGRMTSLTKGSATTAYAYRADGMRVAKTGASSSEVTRYDGQMPVETVETSGSATTVQRNGIGARGTDLIERTTNGIAQVRFPLYDAHGNSVATLGRSGSSWTLGDERAYDAWGRVRQGGQTGAPSARYCASLGHVQDDESGLVYMRARYYEAATGRFVSEDLNGQGKNWFSYCGADPVNRADESGKSFATLEGLVLNLIDQALSAFKLMMRGGPDKINHIHDLLEIQRKLKSIVKTAKFEADLLLDEAEMEASASAYMGAEAGMIEKELTSLKIGLAGGMRAYGVVAQLTSLMIDVMIMLSQGI